MEKIIRHQWRGTLRSGIDEATLAAAIAEVRKYGEQAQCSGRISALCVYRWRGMIFVYTESLQPLTDTYRMLAPLFQLLREWPEFGGPKPLADMYGIYWHAIPGTPEEWLRNRTAEKTRIGRIAFLYPDKLFSYTYWHQAIVDEGLLPGDQYQFISLHENVLFSYYEEPRNNVNLSGSTEESSVIKGWLKVDPESHFDHDIIGTAANFLVIEPLLII